MPITTVWAQLSQKALPSDSGMYVENPNGLTKIIGQIVEFKRTGSLLVSAVTAGIKSSKVNIQLLGPHAQTFTSSRPVFYFVPPRQEADAGVNAGDLILVRLEEKAHRRQFEIGAQGLWRASAGISLNHQIQLYRSEEKSGVYKVTSATALSRGEYALYLSRGEGMAPYVYDFSVEDAASPPATQETVSTPEPAPVRSHSDPQSSRKLAEERSIPESNLQTFSDATIGAFSEGNLDVQHDGVVLTALTPGGPAEQAGLSVGDFILAINDKYLFTINQFKEALSHYPPGTKIRVRYRKRATINEATLMVARVR